MSNLLAQYDFDNKKLEGLILKECYSVFNEINDNGEDEVYRIDSLEVHDDYTLSFLLTKNNLPTSSHSISIEDVSSFNDLNKLIVKDINS